MIIHTSTKIKVAISLLSSLLGFLLPIILYNITCTIEPSISSYHLTDAKWWLFGMLVAMSIGFFISKALYMVSGVLLILIAIFNIDFLLIHNIMAILFFLYTAIIIAFDKRYWIFSVPIFIGLTLFQTIDIYILELIGIWCVCTFNILYALRYLKLVNSN